MPKIGKRQENLLAKIAEALGKNVEEIKEKAAPLYSYEEEVYQRQAIINFFEARVQPTRRMIKENGKSRQETDAEFEARYKEWNFKKCKHCTEIFAYAYTYDGVAYCSLECVDAELKKIGLELTRGRDTKRRWGNHHPAIVPPSALEALQNAFPNPEGTFDVPVQSVLPKFRGEPDHDESSPNPPENIVV